MRKPANLVYGVEEAPPHLVTLISAIQHVGVIAIFMIYPLIIGREAGVSADVLSAMLRMGMLALAVAVLLQALPRGPVGSRFLAPSIFTGVYLAPSLLAVKTGGMPLVWGMTIFAGLIEICALARVDAAADIHPVGDCRPGRVPDRRHHRARGAARSARGGDIGLALRTRCHRRRPRACGDDRPQHLEQGSAPPVLHPHRHGRRIHRSGRNRLADARRFSVGADAAARRDAHACACQLRVRPRADHPVRRQRPCRGDGRHRGHRDLPAPDRCRLGAAGDEFDPRRYLRATASRPAWPA